MINFNFSLSNLVHSIRQTEDQAGTINMTSLHRYHSYITSALLGKGGGSKFFFSLTFTKSALAYVRVEWVRKR